MVIHHRLSSSLVCQSLLLTVAFTQGMSHTEEPWHRVPAFTHKRFTHRSLCTLKLWHRGAFTHNLISTQKLLHTDAFTEKFVYKEPFQSFTQRNFYTHTPRLHTEAFPRRSMCTKQKFLGKGPFTQRSLCAEDPSPGETITGKPIYTVELSNKDAFTQRHLYTEELFAHISFTQRGFRQRHFYAREILRTEVFLHRSFYAQKPEDLQHTHTHPLFRHRNFWKKNV